MVGVSDGLSVPSRGGVGGAGSVPVLGLRWAWPQQLFSPVAPGAAVRLWGQDELPLPSQGLAGCLFCRAP